jgi:hypothetical protein
MKFTPTKRNNQLPNSDSSVFLLGLINVSTDYQNSTVDQQPNDDHKDRESKFNESISIGNQSNYDNTSQQKFKHSSNYNGMDKNYLNYDEEDQMVSYSNFCLFVIFLNPK